MPDYIRSLDTDGSQPLGYQVRVPGELVAGVGAFRSPVSWKIRHEHAPIGRKGRGDVFPREMRIVEAMKQDERYAATCFLVDLGPVQARASDAYVRVCHFDRFGDIQGWSLPIPDASTWKQ